MSDLGSIGIRPTTLPSGRHRLPYAATDDLPAPIQAHLPLHAREIYLAAFNSAWTQYASREPSQREETAHRVAWAAVKHKYQKVGDHWIARESD